MNVSIAMATYNGGKYIREQLLSILNQLTSEDEVVVSDDGSIDNTVAIVMSLIEEYPQIKYIQGPHKGVVRNFENAILNCSNEIIFLSDQDDIWIEGKVERIKNVFNNYSENVVMHRAYRMNSDDKTDIPMVNYHSGTLRNWLKSCYWGCCMAFRRDYINQYLPFRFSNGVAHDQLIGMLAEYDRSVRVIDDILCYHRFHSTNETRKRGRLERVTFRVKLIHEFISCISQKRETRC